MKCNGLELSSEKTNMILFNNGQGPRIMPKFFIDNEELEYVREVKFLGVYLNVKLNWKKHIDYLLQKALKSYNLIKIISSKSWGQDIKTLVHLAVALVRSKLTYGQEIYFSAPKTYLKKLQSLDSKAIKIALGVPVHTKTESTYKTVGILSLDNWRKLTCSKYVIRSQIVYNNTETEVTLRSDIDFNKRAQNIPSLMTIASYVHDIFDNNEIDSQSVAKNVISPIPLWELNSADFDLSYTYIKKDENPFLLSSLIKSHLEEKYFMKLQIYTDGSLLENGHAGAGFVIPDFKMYKSYHLGKGYSIFTAELIAILMALDTLVSMNTSFYSIVFCVDSQSVLKALKSNEAKIRQDLIYEIKYLIHNLIVNGTEVHFCWVPSHCSILYNDWADRAAKDGAKNNNAQKINIQLSKTEIYSILKKSFKEYSIVSDTYSLCFGFPRQITTLAFRLFLNSIRTKYCADITCICGEKLSINHILIQCEDIRSLFPVELKLPHTLEEFSYQDYLTLAKILIYSPIGSFFYEDSYMYTNIRLGALLT